MRIARLISAACVVLSSLLVIGQTFQSLGLSAAEAKSRAAERRAAAERNAARRKAGRDKKS